MSAATLTEAKTWCSEARRILKKSRIGKNERDRFKKANKQIEKLLDRLLPISQVQHDQCEEEYRDIAGDAHTAAENADRAGVEDASKRLTALVVKVEQLLADKKQLDAALDRNQRLMEKISAIESDFGPSATAHEKPPHY